MEAIEAGEPPVYVSRDIVAEVCTVLTRKHSKDLANNFVRFVRMNSEVIIMSDSFTEHLDFFVKTDADLSFQDIRIIHLAEQYDIEILSFDEDLMNVAEKL